MLELKSVGVRQVGVGVGVQKPRFIGEFDLCTAFIRFFTTNEAEQWQQISLHWLIKEITIIYVKDLDLDLDFLIIKKSKYSGIGMYSTDACTSNLKLMVVDHRDNFTFKTIYYNCLWEMIEIG